MFNRRSLFSMIPGIAAMFSLPAIKAEEEFDIPRGTIVRPYLSIASIRRHGFYGRMDETPGMCEGLQNGNYISDGKKLIPIMEPEGMLEYRHRQWEFCEKHNIPIKDRPWSMQLEPTVENEAHIAKSIMTMVPGVDRLVPPLPNAI